MAEKALKSTKKAIKSKKSVKKKMGLKDLEVFLEQSDDTTKALCTENLADGMFLHKENKKLKAYMKKHGMVHFVPDASGNMQQRKSEVALQYNKNLASINNITKTIYTIIKPREGSEAEENPVEKFMNERKR